MWEKKVNQDRNVGKAGAQRYVTVPVVTKGKGGIEDLTPVPRKTRKQQEAILVSG